MLTKGWVILPLNVLRYGLVTLNRDRPSRATERVSVGIRVGIVKVERLQSLLGVGGLYQLCLKGEFNVDLYVL